jgi:hypothetical protein
MAPGLRHRPGPGRHGAASQALPHAGRVVRPAACRNACDRPAPCHRLQSPRRRPSLRLSRDVRWRTNAGRALWDFARSLGAPMALKDLGVTERPRPHGRSGHHATPTGTRARSPRRDPRRCCSARLGGRRAPPDKSPIVWEDDMITRRNTFENLQRRWPDARRRWPCRTCHCARRAHQAWLCQPAIGAAGGLFAEADSFILELCAIPRRLRTSR